MSGVVCLLLLSVSVFVLQGPKWQSGDHLIQMGVLKCQYVFHQASLLVEVQMRTVVESGIAALLIQQSGMVDVIAYSVGLFLCQWHLEVLKQRVRYRLFQKSVFAN
ncbi:hypothetical protein BJ741DRAFT_619395 [Chytriomyces cf. hyalinus JEL632]|nr:hypothetical protein BJ741DRAFT_619395 [Chytriomyces cf. hyalinus JEL632]